MSRPSLRRQILFQTAPAAFIISILASMVGVRAVRTEVRKQIASQVASESHHFADKIQRKLAHTIDGCSAVAGNDVVINAVIDPEHRNSTLQSFVQSLRLAGGEVRNIVMTDYQGEPISSKAPLDDSPISHRSNWLPQVMAGQTYVNLDEDTLTIVQPVLYGGRPEAAIVTTCDARMFFADLCTGTDTSASAVSYRSTPLACSDQKYLSSQNRLLVPASWFVETIPVENVPGLSVTWMKSDDVAIHAENAVLFVLIFETLVALAILVVGLWVATSIATRTLREFIAAIDDVRSNGNLSHRVNVHTTAEFELLGNRFNGMLEEIQNSTVSREAFRIPALVAKHTDNAVIVADPAGQIEWINEGFSRLTGYNMEEVLGRKLGYFLHGDETDPAVIRSMREAVVAQRGVNVELVNYHKTGRAFWVEMEIRPIRSKTKGEVVNFVAIANDITERKNSEKEKAVLSQKMVELSRHAGMAEVANGVLHNVGNVLNSVNISASLLKQWFRSSRVTTLSKMSRVIDDHKETLPEFVATNRGRQIPSMLRGLSEALTTDHQKYQEEAESLLQSIDHIKQIVAKQQGYSGGASLREPVQLEELANEALRMCQDSLNAPGVSVSTEFALVPSVQADRHLVLQILVNLIKNAVNAFEKTKLNEKRIQIVIQGDERHSVSVAVKDNGVGIEKEMLPKIFKHGFTTRKEGHGFGLHSSALAAQSMGGELSVRSDGFMCGAEFSLRLPAVVEDNSPADTGAAVDDLPLQEAAS